MTIQGSTFTVNATVAGVAAGFPTTGLVCRNETNSGLTADGQTGAEWIDSINGAVFTDPEDVSSPFEGPALTTVLGIAQDGGLISTDMAAMPSGNVDISIAAALQAGEGVFGFCGVGLGNPVANEAIIVGFDNNGYVAVDFFGTRLSDPSQVDIRGGDPVYVGVSYTASSGLVELYKNGVKIAQTNKTLSIGTTSVNIMRTFSGIGSAGWIGAWAIWETAKDAAAHLQAYTFWHALYLKDIQAPKAIAIGLGNATANSEDWNITASEPGTKWLILSDEVTEPSIAQVKAGLSQSGATAAYSTLGTELLKGVNTGTATGLDNETPYYLFAVLRDKDNNERLVSYTNGGSGISTTAPAENPPEISGAAVAATSSSTALGAITIAGSTRGVIYRIATDTSSEPSSSTVLAAGLSQAYDDAGIWPVNYIVEDAAGEDRWFWVVVVDTEGNASDVTQLIGPGTGGKVTMPTLAPSDLTPDYTASSRTELEAKLAEWEADWSGTAAAIGKTSGDDRVLGYTFSTSSTVDMSGYDFSTASGRQRVTVRGVGTFSASGTGNSTVVNFPCTWSGTIDMRGSKNMTLMLTKIVGPLKLLTYATTDVTITRNYFLGSGLGDWTTAGGAPQTGQTYAWSITGTPTGSANPVGDYPLDTVRLTFSQNLIQGFADAGILLFGNATDLTIEDNLSDIIAHDDAKYHNGTKVNFIDRRNWGCRIRSSRVAGYHEDFRQWSKGTYTNCYCYGNVAMRGRWYGEASGAYQNWFVEVEAGSTLTINGLEFNNNIMVGNAKGIHVVGVGGSGRKSWNNTSLFVTDLQNVDSMYLGKGVSDEDRNVCSVVTGTSDNEAGQGPNGIRLNYGNDGGNLDLTEFLVHYDAPILTTSGIEAIIPKTTSPMHWDYGSGFNDRVGAWLRLKEIFVDGMHPGNAGLPTGPIWWARYNPNNAAEVAAVSTYTGNFDSDGLNAA